MNKKCPAVSRGSGGSCQQCMYALPFRKVWGVDLSVFRSLRMLEIENKLIDERRQLKWNTLLSEEETRASVPCTLSPGLFLWPQDWRVLSPQNASSPLLDGCRCSHYDQPPLSNTSHPWNFSDVLFSCLWQKNVYFERTGVIGSHHLDNFFLLKSTD